MDNARARVMASTNERYASDSIPTSIENRSQIQQVRNFHIDGIPPHHLTAAHNFGRDDRFYDDARISHERSLNLLREHSHRETNISPTMPPGLRRDRLDLYNLSGPIPPQMTHHPLASAVTQMDTNNQRLYLPSRVQSHYEKMDWIHRQAEILQSPPVPPIPSFAPFLDKTQSESRQALASSYSEVTAHVDDSKAENLINARENQNLNMDRVENVNDIRENDNSDSDRTEELKSTSVNDELDMDITENRVTETNIRINNNIDVNAKQSVSDMRATDEQDVDRTENETGIPVNDFLEVQRSSSKSRQSTESDTSDLKNKSAVGSDASDLNISDDDSNTDLAQALPDRKENARIKDEVKDVKDVIKDESEIKKEEDTYGDNMERFFITDRDVDVQLSDTEKSGVPDRTSPSVNYRFSSYINSMLPQFYQSHYSAVSEGVKVKEEPGSSEPQFGLNGETELTAGQISKKIQQALKRSLGDGGRGKKKKAISGKNGEKIYPCNVCDKVYTNTTSLRHHKMIHTGERPHKCDVCEKAFRKRATLLCHKRTHTGEKPFQCEQCGKSYRTPGDLVVHRRVHTGERPFSCKFCGKTFATSYHVREHERRHSKETGGTLYLCDFCGKSFTTKLYLRRHKENVHLPMGPIDESKLLPCSCCDKKFKTIANLQRHQVRKTGDKIFQCTQCDKRFTTDDYLKKHIKVHGERLYSCPNCDKSFVSPFELKRHSKKHLAEKPFKCDICNKTFLTPHYVKVHRARHAEKESQTLIPSSPLEESLPENTEYLKNNIDNNEAPWEGGYTH